MLCYSGSRHCLHRWGNTELNLGGHYTKKDTQQSKSKTDTQFQFPVFMNAIYHMFSTRCVTRRTMHFPHSVQGQRCSRMSCYFVNVWVWCCKLFIWVLSVVKDMMFLEWKTICNAILIHSNFQIRQRFGCNVYFVLYRQSDRSLIRSVSKAMLSVDVCLFIWFFLFTFSLRCPLTPLKSPAWFIWP